MAHNCKYAQQIGAHHDGALSSVARRAFEAHLADCTTCGQELKVLERLSRLLAELPQVDLPGPLRTRLHGIPAILRERESVLLAMAKTLSAAAAILIICGALAIGFARRNERSLAPPAAWELAAIMPQEEIPASETHRIAQWFAVDLASGNAQ